MDRLVELLAQFASLDIATLSDEDLATWRTDFTAACREARDGELSAEANERIREGVTHVQAIAELQTTRAADAAAIVADADDALAALDALDPDPEPEPEADPAPEADADPAPEADATPEAEPAAAAADTVVDLPAADVEPEPEAIAASAPALNPHVRVPARHAPKPAAAKRRRGFVASGEVPGIGAGHEFENMAEVAHALAEKQDALKGSSSTEKHKVASLDFRDEFEHAIGDGMAPQAITDAFDQIIYERRERREAMVAAGGIQGPPEPRYDQIVYGQADRPVWAAQPGVNAPRGQIIYNDSPTLDDIVVDTTAGAIDTITNADDIADTSKTIQTISGVTPTTTTVRARTLRFKNGNAFDRFLPERGRAFMHLGAVGYARHGDMLLLQDMKTLSTKYTNAVAELGAYRDFKAHILGTVAEIRDHIRDYSVPIHLVVPEFVPTMLAVDVTRQLPGDNQLAAAAEQMRRDIASWGVTAHFAKDSIRGRLLTTPTQPGGTASPRTPGFDTDVEWCMYPEGTFLTLDGGTLDLGIVRDDTLNTTNKFTTFFETWEAIAKVGPYAYWGTSSLCPSGTSAAGTTSIVCQPQGS